MAVSSGQALGLEGDVGITAGHPGTSPPPTGPCVPTMPPDYDYYWGCEDHLHFAVFRATTGEMVMPMTCSLPWFVYEDESDITAGNACFCDFHNSLSGVTFSGLGNMRVYQGTTLTASTLVVQNGAAVVLRGSTKVRLLPGFRAGAGDSYFRAEQALCNQTAPSNVGIFTGPIPPAICPACP